MVAIGIDLGIEKTQAAFFDKTCIEPMIIATTNGYGILSENSILETFTELKKTAGASEAVIAVPGYFNKSQREMIKKTGESVGFKISRIIHKPSAVSLAYEHMRAKKQLRKEELVAVCAIDKGLIEIAIVEFGDGVVEIQIIDWDNAFDDLTQKLFEELFRRIIAEKKHQMIEAALAEGKPTAGINFTSDQIDAVIVNGEPTYLKPAQSLISAFFKNKIEIIANENLSAVGASIQSAILCGHVKDKLLLDITSLSIGVDVLGNVMKIPRHTTIPAKKTERFSLANDGQQMGNINVFEGENEIVTQNHLIGELVMGKKINMEVTIEIDANSTIHITVKDMDSGKTINTLNI